MLLLLFIFLLVSIILIITAVLWNKLPIITRNVKKTHEHEHEYEHNHDSKYKDLTCKKKKHHHHPHKHIYEQPQNYMFEKKIYTRPVSMNFGINPKPNIVVRSNPYMMTNKCPPCPKIKECPKCPKCPKSADKTDYDSDFNIPIGNWIPVPQSECIV